LEKLHEAWIAFVLARVLGFDADHIAVGNAMDARYRYTAPENGVTFAPDALLIDGKPDSKIFALVKVFGAGTELNEASLRNGWAATPIERVIELCRAVGVRLALVTNGERWVLIDAPVGAVVSVASWYARLWSQEPTTLQAFADLLGIRRFFGSTGGELSRLLDKSLTLQDEVTDALGEQVRRAVEVLVQSLDRANQDRNGELLKDVSPSELYEAGLTLMMRVVFLLSAEERGLLLLGDARYEADYAVSTLRGQLRQQPDEVLERRWDAWSRLLALFRAVFAGVDHGAMRMPALGGSLFDPDRFPFLEGRAKGSNWKTDPAIPLPIDNQTVLLLLDAVQLFQGRALSYLALDVEQIGYVYEGLLERTVVRAEEPTLDLKATKNALSPWAGLSELDAAVASGNEALEDLIKERTGSSASRIRNDLAKPADETDARKLLAACHGDVKLRDRLRPYFHLLRTDSWGYPLVYPKGTFMVASGSDRRETGTHYTPKSFTEVIVKTTLEPLVYVGPSDGAPRDRWKLKSSENLLELKICDLAMGSGAFLVQVCRYLGERVVEAWAEAENAGKRVSAEGDVKADIGSSEPITQNVEERALIARRLIAEQCLYGVDMNPLAVELAKLSIWLVTLAKGRPFGFLDHNLRSGDSLLGITTLDQPYFLRMKPDQSSSKKLFAAELDKAVTGAVNLRRELRRRVIRDIADVHAMEELERQARTKLSLSIVAADALIGSFLVNEGDSSDSSALLASSIGDVLQGKFPSLVKLQADAKENLSTGVPDGKGTRRPFHWPLEFPEVFERERPGFDAFVGNPPFLGGRRISGALGKAYERYLKNCLTTKKGSADLCAYFFLRANTLCRITGCFGLLATNTIAQTDTRSIGLETIAAETEIYSAVSSVPWPGMAAVSVAIVHGYKGKWSGQRWLNQGPVEHINASLADTTFLLSAKPLDETKARYFGTKGTYVHGTGFVLSAALARRFLDEDVANAEVLKPYLVAKDFTTSPVQSPGRWVIDFGSRSEADARRYAELFSHVERTVRPQREKLVGQIHEASFWKFWDKRAELYARVHELENVIVCPEVSKYSVFALVKNDCIFSHMVNVVASDSYGTFACLQSSVHSLWAWFQGSTMETRLRYTTSDCLDTFPFPENVSSLASVGELFHRERAKVMSKSEEGLTKIYNRVHNKDRLDGDTVGLRDLIAATDAAVFAAYGWHDLHEVLSHRETALGLRYSYSKSVSDEIIRRLLLLNNKRYDIERGDGKSRSQTPQQHDSPTFWT
jgi:hypothetical protein